jgi:hypothetical protein
MKLRQTIALFTFAASTLCLTSCGGSGSSPTPPAVISVALNPPPTTSLTVGATASLTAVVSNDSKGGGVTWTVTCATSPCGSFNPATTPSGTATTYTAPATPTTVNVTATSVSDTTKLASATIVIAPPAISVTFNPQPPTSLSVSATTSVTAVVTNDSKNAGVNWTVTCGTSSCGSFTPATTASGAATTYTAPATVPSPGTVNIIATSITDTTKSASATITIGAAPALVADGTYVFHLSGQDAPTGANLVAGPYFVVGAFTVQGGVITAGEQDFTDSNNISTDKLVPANCSITKAGGNIQIVLATANTGIGINGVETLRGTTVSSSRILISEFDTLAAATGSIDLQTTVATPSGGYAFAISGLDLQNVLPLAIGGILNFSGGNLLSGSSVLDYNDGGNFGQAQMFASGTVTTPDSFGRVTFTFTFASTVPNFILTGYIIGPNQIQLLENQPDSLNADIGGVALGQGNKTGGFSQANIANATYVHASSGQDINSGIYDLVTLAGTFSFNSAGGVSGNLALSDGLNFGVGTFSSATYIVDPTGRVTLQGVVISSQLPSMTFQLYLDGNGNALELGVDGFQITQGLSYAQNAPPTDFEGSYALAGQGYLPNPNGTVPFWGAAGPVTVNSDAFNGTTDYTIQGATPTASVALTGTETNSTALLSLTGLNGTNFSTTNSYGYFPIDSKRVFAIELDGQMLGLLQLEGVSH